MLVSKIWKTRLCPTPSHNSDVINTCFQHPTFPLLLSLLLAVGLLPKNCLPFFYYFFLEISTTGGTYYLSFRSLESNFKIWTSHDSLFIVQKETGEPWVLIQLLLRQMGNTEVISVQTIQRNFQDCMAWTRSSQRA